MTKGDLLAMLKDDDEPSDRLVWISVFGGAAALQTMEITNVKTVIPHNGYSTYIEIIAVPGEA